MTAFQNATDFFHACESLRGWAGCEPYVAPGASFSAQSEPLADIDTVQGYTEWMATVGSGPLPGCSYDLHASAWDEATRTALFFATFNGTHTGEGGPVPPTNRSISTEYVYVLTMNDDDKVGRMVKVWNAAWALTELGWMGGVDTP